ncbi:MAG: hypothetical protein ABT02_12670 [Comamonadaceae bacterium SCN 68-20]|nr:PepSY domain-containing protein [Comamonadaceae bacterium]ODU59008.1 MAG: hypothetical protein ABT02_12670 [Comamonadaceae bacterium SCN 68-20]OJX27901.1 MAG: hypothetical protein BGO75_00645 [Burkholderiales bacterium 68-20]
MRTATLKGWLWVHKWSSLVSMTFLLMLCITGLPLIFKDEIHHWLDPHPELGEVAPGTPRPTLQNLAEQALASRPVGHVVTAVSFEEEEPDVLLVSTAATLDPPPNAPWPGQHTHAFDQRDGRLVLQEPPAREGFMYVMQRLHVDLFLYEPGMLFLGVMGLVMFAAIVSGVMVYAPFMRKLDFATVRAARGPRVLWLDLHNLLGIVTLMWLSVVTLTGVLNTLAGQVARSWQANELGPMVALYKHEPLVMQRAPVDAVIATARQAAPEHRLISIFYPGRTFSSPRHFTVVYLGNTPVTSRLLTLALIDAKTAELKGFVPIPWYAKTLFLSRPLHFGDYGSLPLKIVWMLLTLMTIVVSGSGIYLWLRKPAGRKAKVRSPTGANEAVA